MRTALLSGVSTAAVLFGVFAAYAFLSPATYRTTAVVVLESAPNTATTPPLDAARRLHESVLDAKTIQELAGKDRNKAPSGADADMAEEVRSALDIATDDGRTFRISYRADEPERAQELTNDVAQRAVARIPVVFAPEPTDEQKQREAARQRHAEELLAFLAQHPELTSEPSSAPRSRGETGDPLLMTLRAERGQLEQRLAKGVPSSSPSDNPYSDPASVDSEVPRLRRRLVQVNNAIQARREALAKNSEPAGAPPTSELRARWQQLLQAASQSSAATPAAPPPPPTGRVSELAPLPSSPIEPDRSLLLIVGLLIGVGGGVLVGVIRSAGTERQRASAEHGDDENVDAFRDTLDAPVVEPTRPSNVTDESAPEPQPGPVVAEEPRREAGLILPPPSDAPPAILGASYVPDPFGPSPQGAGPERSVVSAELDTSGAASLRDTGSGEASGIQLTESAAKLPPGRVTQAFGSPIEPVLPPGRGPSAMAFQRPVQRSTPPAASTSYRYVSTPVPAGPPDGEVVTGTRPISSAPPVGIGSVLPARHLDSMPPPADVADRSARDTRGKTPISEARRIGQGPTEPLQGRITAPLTSATIVTTHAIDKGWRPDPSLKPESRRQLCTELYPLAVQQCFVLGVSGVRGAADDAARASAEIALALAETSHPRILLLEGNLQRPSIHRLMHVEMPLFAGFSEQLEGRIQSGNQRAPWGVLACSSALHVLAEGVMRIPELILSRQFEQCIQELREYYDVIVISGPVISEVAACRAVQDIVDGAVLVCPKAGSPDVAEASALFSQKRFSTVLAAG